MHRAVQSDFGQKKSKLNRTDFWPRTELNWTEKFGSVSFSNWQGESRASTGFGRRASKHSRTSVKIFAMEQAGLRSEIRARLRSERLRDRFWLPIFKILETELNRTPPQTAPNQLVRCNSILWISLTDPMLTLGATAPSLWWLCSYDIAMWGWV